MTNLIGDDIALIADIARQKDTAIHLYGKSDARPGRKMGHVNRILHRT
jgi:5-(carboxyamino)imidazole ribonucleotide synthase